MTLFSQGSKVCSSSSNNLLSTDFVGRGGAEREVRNGRCGTGGSEREARRGGAERATDSRTSRQPAMQSCPVDAKSASEPDIPWSEIARMRDQLTHHYFDTADSIVQATATNGWPLLWRACAPESPRVL